MLTAIAFLILRISIAWLFLSPLKQFIPRWKTTVEMVRFLIPFQPQLFSILMIAAMFLGSLSILFGFYAQVGAVLLAIQCLLGFCIHNKYVKKIMGLHLSVDSTESDRKILQCAKGLGIMGNKTSGQKNLIIAVILLFIILVGSGPYSLT